MELGRNWNQMDKMGETNRENAGGLEEPSSQQHDMKKVNMLQQVLTR